MGLIEHAKEELKLAGYNIDKNVKDINSDHEYADMVAQSVLELIEVFAKQGHSGMSASFTLNIFNQLARHKNLTPLTNKPEEWVDMIETGMLPEDYKGFRYQSKRCSSCFSKDLKDYYDIDDPENNIYERDEEGNFTGYASLKPEEERKLVELQNV